jgi:phosphoribosylformylglycinamidine (FGAM) synthase-like enzyme
LDLTLEKILFGEEQSRYVISTSKENENKIFELAKNANIEINLISEVIEEYFEIDKELKVKISDLIKINEEVFDKKFS